MASIYLDYAAATPIDEAVLAAMQPYLTTEFYNPSATYSAARRTHQALLAAREQFARSIGSKTSEVIFTAGGTEANNLAIHGVMRQYPESSMLISAIEHSAVIKPADHYNNQTIPVKTDGIIDLTAAEALIDDQTVLISCMYANNEIGTVQPVRQLAQLINKIRHQRREAGIKLPLYLHVDACQAPNYLDVQVARLGADLVSFNGSKIYGPKQTGALFIAGGIVLTPLVDGGGQERGLRSGTENIAGFIGLAAALELAVTHRKAETERLKKLQELWFKELSAKLPQAIINGSLRQRLPNNIHLTIPGSDNERLLIQLDEAGIMAAAGSACSASSQVPSAVLAALGLDDVTARSSIRFTMGRSTTEAEVLKTIDSLVKLTA